ncbi:50S ribosomal protein L7/L12 [Gleimia hominis]|uniref:Large ribosomal subunit protein bL12 n=1 Tax=Gleimia hominis TaxID=595468 RepID=A0ABU3I9T0_9ACTO|nr:50S ribosomal protein L7/L12 [Gleimia hominis]MDT3767130.1 50S ribosomal protein L7/L12 [Gleimia hominis]
MAKLTAEELIDAFKELTLVELSDFIKKFEEEFDVEAAAPVAAVAAAPAAGGEADAAEEQTEFEVVLESFGDKKVAVIKAVKAITGEGLKDAKDRVEGAPSTVAEGVSKEDAEKMKADIEAAGGTVTLK